MNDRELETPEKVINLLTKREIDYNRPTFRKLMCNGFRYVKDLAEFLGLPDAIDYYYLKQIRFMNDLFHSAMIPLIDIMKNRPDIYKKWSI
ncbi:7991_t:CDS:1, partial [Cetraspora pellucida]